MIRLLNVIAVLALIGSAVYAYSIKYETIFASERLAKVKNEMRKERDSINTLKAEFAYLSRPERIQALSDKHLDLQQLQINQIVQPSDLPDRAPKVDAIGRKLEMLGLSEPTNTPRDVKTSGSATTPGAR